MADGSRLNDVLDAIGDPTRRQVLEILRSGEQSVREITDQTSVSQPAVSQHLSVLRDVGLVTSRPDGRRNLYRIEPAPLDEIRVWVESFWDTALAAFVEHANKAAKETP